MLACKLIWWAVGSRMKEKQGEKDKAMKKEETENAPKTATILWRFLLAIFHN